MTDEEVEAILKEDMRHDLRYIMETCFKDSERWFPDVFNDITMITLGITGEAGEVADELKKMIRGTRSPEEGWPKYAMELVDVLIYVCCAAKILNLDLAEAFWEKRQFNEERFGKGNADSGDKSALASEVRRQQSDPLGSASFVCEGDVQIKVQSEAPR